MEVEALQQTIAYPFHVIGNREISKPFHPGLFASGVLIGNEPTSAPDSLFHSSLASDLPLLSSKMSMDNKADSGLTCNVQPVTSPVNLLQTRKRARDPSPHLETYSTLSSKCSKLCTGPSLFVGDDVNLQFQQHQSEISHFLTEHTQKLRLQMEEQRKRQYRLLMDAVQEGIMMKLREKDDELIRLAKMNWALQERVKALYVENQLWRDLAQTNEATANSLRSNLEEVLAHVGDDRKVVQEEDDAESVCGSSEPRKADDESISDKEDVVPHRGTCRKCGERESGVLLLPCRHLCLCTLCGSSASGTCPICDSVMSASVHVNLP